MSQSNRLEIPVNFDAVSEIMALGANRASSFMFLGLRSAGDETITSVRLDTTYEYQFMPDPLSPKQAIEVRENFGKWIIGSGLRELDHHFAKALDEAYTLHILIKAGASIRAGDLIEQQRPFTNKTNAGDKLETVARALGGCASLLPHIRSLSAARNALTHNGGVVLPRHTTPGQDCLILKWRGLDVRIGTQTLTGPFDPVYVEAGQEVAIVASDREKPFQIGSEIELSPHELHEICLTYVLQADEVKMSVVEFARRNGLSVDVVKPPSSCPC